MGSARALRSGRGARLFAYEERGTAAGRWRIRFPEAVRRCVRSARALPCAAASACSTWARAPAIRLPRSPSWPETCTPDPADPRARRVGARKALACSGIRAASSSTWVTGRSGFPEHAPYDGIAVAAAASGRPATRSTSSSAPGGRLVVPVGTPARPAARDRRAQPRRSPAVARSVPCRFVPLLGAAGFDEHRRRVGRPRARGRRHPRCCARPCSHAGSASARWRACSSMRRSRGSSGSRSSAVTAPTGSSPSRPRVVAPTGSRSTARSRSSTRASSSSIAAARPLSGERAGARRGADRAGRRPRDSALPPTVS